MSMRRVATTLGLSLLLLSGSGCVSLEHLLDPGQPLQMYGGVKSAATYISSDAGSNFGALARIIDFPATAVLDTLLLPVSAPVELSR